MKKGLSVMAKKLITIFIIFILLILIFLMSCAIDSAICANRHDIRSRRIHPMERKISRECRENLGTEYNSNPGSKITMDSID